MQERMIFAGFGGQGVLSLGKIIAELALEKDLHVTWFPAYGAEMRGGTANCHVIYSDEPVDNPIVNNDISILFALNNPSLDKFLAKVRPGGTVIVNSSVVDKTVDRDDVNVIEVDAANIAAHIGDLKVQNMVMLGTFLKVRDHFSIEEVNNQITKMFTGKKERFVPLNKEAVSKGAQ
jgi:2-oxoglutarate ferredoxin oxidoreductase subunit gamma